MQSPKGFSQISLAACVSKYELVLSDHRSIVDICYVEGMFLSKYPYNFAVDIVAWPADHVTILPYDEGDLEQPQIPVKTLYNC